MRAVWLLGSRFRTPRGLKWLFVVAWAGCLVGCATYRPAPLPDRSNLAKTITGLRGRLEQQGCAAVCRINTQRPLTIDQIGILAILNDPDLKLEFGTVEEARAAVVQARLLPNPAVNLSYGAIVSGFGTASVAGSLSQSFAALLTHDSQIRSAEADLYRVNAEQVWREWQVAQKARQLALDIYWANVGVGVAEREQRLMSQEISEVERAVQAGDVSLETLAPLAKASAAVDQSLMRLRLDRLEKWQQLDGLLGLDPTVRFAIARPRLELLPHNIEALITAIPDQRPDLAALRLGYGAAEEDVRVAILGQFPGLMLGGSYSSDTTGAITAGPNFNFALPIFDRNQGQIAKALASRQQLEAKYQAGLDEAVGTAYSLIAQIRQLSGDLIQTRQAAAQARSLADTAHRAYNQSNLDQRTLTDYETTALERTLEVVTIERQIDEDKIFLAVELGLGLPQMRIALREDMPANAKGPPSSSTGTGFIAFLAQHRR